MKYGCPFFRSACNWSIVTIKTKDLRLEERRAYEKTDEFRERYRIRSGIEATNSLLKRITGLGRLRVRGRPAVFNSILLKIAGWNILRASSVRDLIDKLKQIFLGEEKEDESSEDTQNIASIRQYHLASHFLVVTKRFKNALKPSQAIAA